MDTKTPIRLEGARLARASAAGALCVLAVISSLAPPQAHADATSDRAAATRLYTRITGVPPDATTLAAMQPLIASNPQGAAAMATAAPQFYNVTLKNIFLPATNRDQSVFVPLNDYVATAIGMIRDDVPFNTALSADILYTVSGVSPAASAGDNVHYATAETNNVDLSKNLAKSSQTAVYGNIAPAGLITTRASSSAFFVNGTNRAMFRFTLINHLCHDMEQVQDTSRPTDQIRQDVAPSPGGDSRVYLNTCVGCHSGMDPMARAFAYYNFDAVTTMKTVYTPGTVNAKYFINSSNNPFGFVTPDDTWSNRWRAGPNSVLGFDSTLPGTGKGAASLGAELAASDAFADCQVQKAFKAVCLRAPSSQADATAVGTIKAAFKANGYKMKQVFADAAVYCTVTAP
jgi:hypothetical protein